MAGDLTNEEAVLEWLIHNRSTGDDEDVIEDVTSASLEAMVASVENLAVLFCKGGDFYCYFFKYGKM